jgi:hypothetical protein
MEHNPRLAANKVTNNNGKKVFVFTGDCHQLPSFDHIKTPSFDHIKMPKFDVTESPSAPHVTAFTPFKDAMEAEGIQMKISAFWLLSRSAIPLTISVLTPHVIFYVLQAQAEATGLKTYQVSMENPDMEGVAATALKRSGGYGAIERIKMPKYEPSEAPSTPVKGGMADASAAMSPAAFSMFKDRLDSEGVEMRVHVFSPPSRGVNGAPALFKVAAFDFMNNKAFKTYWTHKPEILAEVLALDAQMALAADGNKLPGFLHDLRVALVRRLPCGPNEVSSYESGKAKVKIEKMVFYTYVPLKLTIDDFKVLTGNFLELVKSDAVKHAYYMSLGRKINSEAFVSHAHPGTGKHWEKLTGAAKNPNVIEEKSLNCLFMDSMVVKMVGDIYGSGDLGQALWTPEMKSFAFNFNVGTKEN